MSRVVSTADIENSARWMVSCALNPVCHTGLLLLAFSWRARIFGECSTVHSPPARFVVCFVVLVEISSRALIPHCRPGSVHSGSAS